jgi:hypothetical protein
MLEKVSKYFDKEYKELKQWFDNPLKPNKETKRIAVNNAVARCLGVAMFVQDCGVTYDEVAVHFDKVKIKLLKLLESEE